MAGISGLSGLSGLTGICVDGGTSIPEPYLVMPSPLTVQEDIVLDISNLIQVFYNGNHSDVVDFQITYDDLNGGSIIFEGDSVSPIDYTGTFTDLVDALTFGPAYTTYEPVVTTFTVKIRLNGDIAWADTDTFQVTVSENAEEEPLKINKRGAAWSTFWNPITPSAFTTTAHERKQSWNGYPVL